MTELNSNHPEGPLETKADAPAQLPPQGGRSPSETDGPRAQGVSEKGAAEKGAAKPGPVPPRHDNWRETVESVVVAFVLAFLFRTFEAEAFVIPTGSMAPTLYGQNLDVHCTKCGARFAVSASHDTIRSPSMRLPFFKRRQGAGILNPDQRGAAAVCYNCGFPNNVLKDEIFNGDRILVNKFPYEMGDPDRWDVIVFKNPNEAKINYIKRLAGLPGEEVRIEWGDVFVRKLGSQDPFRIPRKAPDKQRKLQIPVYDNDHPARELLNAGWPERWSGDEGSAWSGDPEQRSFRIDPDPLNPDRVHWLRYRHLVPSSEDWIDVEQNRPIKPPRPQLITDFCAYNAKISVQDTHGNLERLPELRSVLMGTQWVGDLTISSTVELLAAEGELTCELVEGVRRYRCRIDLKTGVASFFYLDGQIKNEEESVVELGEADTELKNAGEYKLSFANVDDRICLWVNDRLVKSVEFEPGSRHVPPSAPIAPTKHDLMPVGFAAKGAKLRLTNLFLERDIFYLSSPDGNEISVPQNVQEFRSLLSDPDRWFEVSGGMQKPARFELKDETNDLEDQFFVLGDNSPQSSDSRAWTESPAVPRRLLIGKAFFIYWPHAIPFLNSGKGYAIDYYRDPGPADPATGKPTVGKEAKPPVPTSSFPFYPQVGRMKRIR